MKMPEKESLELSEGEGIYSSEASLKNSPMRKV